MAASRFVVNNATAWGFTESDDILEARVSLPATAARVKTLLRRVRFLHHFGAATASCELQAGLLRERLVSLSRAGHFAINRRERRCELRGKERRDRTRVEMGTSDTRPCQQHVMRLHEDESERTKEPRESAALAFNVGPSAAATEVCKKLGIGGAER